MSLRDTAEHNAKFLIDDPGFCNTNEGWCHRFAPFRSFITNENVIQAIKYFKNQHCQNGYPNFNYPLMGRYCGNDYNTYYYTKMLMQFIQVLCASTDNHGRIIKGNLQNATLSNHIQNKFIQTRSYNKLLFETVGNILAPTYATSTDDMDKFLDDTVKILTDFKCSYNWYALEVNFPHNNTQCGDPQKFSSPNGRPDIFSNPEVHCSHLHTLGHWYNVIRRNNGKFSMCGWEKPLTSNNIDDCLSVKRSGYLPANRYFSPRVTPMLNCELNIRDYKFKTHIMPGLATGISAAEIKKMQEIQKAWIDYDLLKLNVELAITAYKELMDAFTKQNQCYFYGNLIGYQQATKEFNEKSKDYWRNYKYANKIFNKYPILQNIENHIFDANGFLIDLNAMRFFNQKG